MKELMEIEIEFINELYEGDIELIKEAKTFLEYNANKALQNLGYEPYYKTKAEDVNPIIFKGINTSTKNHDFFSTKGNGYIKTTKVEELTDDDFKY